MNDSFDAVYRWVRERYVKVLDVAGDHSDFFMRLLSATDEIEAAAIKAECEAFEASQAATPGYTVYVEDDWENEPMIVMSPHGGIRNDSTCKVILYFVDNHAIDVVHWRGDSRQERAFVGREEVDDLELFTKLAAAIEDAVPATAWEEA